MRQLKNNSVITQQRTRVLKCLLKIGLQTLSALLSYKTWIIFGKVLLTWVGLGRPPSIHCRGQKRRGEKYVKALNEQRVTIQKTASAHICGSVRVCHLRCGQGGNLRDGASHQRGQRMLRYRERSAKYNNLL